MSIARSTPMRPEQLQAETERINELVNTMIPEETTGAIALRALAVAAIFKYIDTLDYGSFPPNFTPGERVAYVSSGNEPTRPGTVVEIDIQPVVQAHLRVRFDDGEERQINPDVMRSIRDEAGEKIFIPVATPVATYITSKEA